MTKYYSFKSVLTGIANKTIVPISSDLYYFCCRRSRVFTEIDQIPGFVRLLEDSCSETPNNATFDRSHFADATLKRWDEIKAILDAADQEKRIKWAFNELGENLWSDGEYRQFRIELFRQNKKVGMPLFIYPLHEEK
jgi:hypothetical protein